MLKKSEGAAEKPLLTDGERERYVENRIKELAAFYLPEWNGGNDNEAISVLTRIYAQLEAENIKLLPQMRERIRVLFLNMYGLSRKLAEPARGSVTVTPTGNGSVFVKKGTRLCDDSGIVFTAAENLTAVKTELKGIFCTAPGVIVREENLSFFDYSGDNLQDVSLCFSSESIFCGAAGCSFEVSLYDTSRPDQNGELPPLNIEDGEVKWSVIGGKGETELAGAEIQRNHAVISVSNEIPITEFNGVMGRWVKLSLSDELLPRAVSPKIITLTASGTGLKPTAVYCNDSMLTDNDFFPFGRQPSEYDSFYIFSDECFSKKKSSVRIKLNYALTEVRVDGSAERVINWKNVMPAEAFAEKPSLEKYIEEAIWEYWNGSGWCRIFRDNSYEKSFTDKNSSELVIDFICPDDMEKTFVSAGYGLFVRCRIARLSAGYRDNMSYFVPLVSGVELGFDYNGISAPPDCVVLSRNTEKIELTGSKNGTAPINISGLTENVGYSAYICYDAPPQVGIFSVKPIVEKPSSAEETPYAEILCSDGHSEKWYPLAVTDKSFGFKRSENIAIYINRIPVKKQLFGTEGCWIRLTYGEKPESFSLSEMHFNSVEVMQYEEKPPVYFTVDRFSENFTAQLADINVINVSVSVLKDGEWRPCGDDEYTVGRESGTVKFKRLPPKGDEPTVMVKYCTTVGSEGNLPEESISSFLDPIPFVDSVTNPAAAYGGTDGETDEECLSRGSNFIRTFERCISFCDYEDAARRADRTVVKAQCREADDKILLYLLPDRKSESSFELIRGNVTHEILPIMPFYLRGRLEIIRARYAEIKITARIEIMGTLYPQSAANEAAESVKRFLDPIVGGVSGRGYRIGEIPELGEIANVIMSSSGVSAVMAINAQCIMDAAEIPWEKLRERTDAVPYPLEPEIIVEKSRM